MSETMIQVEAGSDLNGRFAQFLFEVSADLILEYDTAGAIKEASSSLASFLGYERTELLHLNPLGIGDSVYLESLHECRAGKNHTIAGSLLHREGHHLRVAGSGKVLGESMFLCLSPVEPHRITQAQKLESIGQLASGIAHEINTPTQYVGGNVAFLQDGFNDILPIVQLLVEIAEEASKHEKFKSKCDEVLSLIEVADLDLLQVEIPKAIDQTMQGIDQIARIVRAMKEFSHPDSGERTLVQINSAIESTMAVARNEWKYVAEVVKDLDPNLPMVSCWAGEFNQVLLNILVNAAHAIGEKTGDSAAIGTITIKTRREGDFVKITMSDTGAGIPDHARSRIFDPFFTTKEVGKGTGQGLALAYVIVVERHGGTISFDTEVGVGTTFNIRIPIVASSSEAA
jgi:signal transduction histidine kinase